MPLSRRSFLAAAAGLAALPKVMQRAPLTGDSPLVGDAPPAPVTPSWTSPNTGGSIHRWYSRMETVDGPLDTMYHVQNEDGSVSTFDSNGDLVMHDPGYKVPPRLTWSGTFTRTG